MVNDPKSSADKNQLLIYTVKITAFSIPIVAGIFTILQAVDANPYKTCKEYREAYSQKVACSGAETAIGFAWRVEFPREQPYYAEAIGQGSLSICNATTIGAVAATARWKEHSSFFMQVYPSYRQEGGPPSGCPRKSENTCGVFRVICEPQRFTGPGKITRGERFLRFIEKWPSVIHSFLEFPYRYFRAKLTRP